MSGMNAQNPQTQKVMNYMAWVRSKKQIVWEFFGLREEAVYDDNWENVIDYINDFKEARVLEAKKVGYLPRLSELWVSEEDFNSLFYWEIPNYNKNGKKQSSNSGSTPKPETVQPLQSDSDGAEDSVDTTGWDDTKWRWITSMKRKTNNKKKSTK